MSRAIIKDGYERGLKVAEIARLCGSTPNTVRVTAHRMGLRHPLYAAVSEHPSDRDRFVPRVEERSVDPVWSMDEDDRRAAFARRAAEGARKALEQAGVQ